MIGIAGVGVHIARYRLSGQTLAAMWGGAGGGERAVASHDEDSLTMAAEAGLAALAGRGGQGLGGVMLATTTPPYAEKRDRDAGRADLPPLPRGRRAGPLLLDMSSAVD